MKAFIFILNLFVMINAYATKQPKRKEETAAKSLYMQLCASCHNSNGNGQGPLAYALNPKPTNFQKGVYKHTNAKDEKGLKQDIIKIIKNGIPHTAMGSFKYQIKNEKEFEALADYILRLKQAASQP
jgi:mono/diheme cytochrome c family protein